MIKQYKYNDISIKVFFKDNGSKRNLLCIHGFNSDLNFTGRINDELTNYNIISINYGQLKNLHIVNIVKMFNEIINDLKLDNISILAHSFGSVIALEVANYHDIDKIFLVNPFHSFITRQKWYDELKAIVNHQTKNNSHDKTTKAFNSIFKDRIVRRTLNTFTDQNNKWNYVLKQILTNDDYINGELANNYNKHRSKLVFFVSKHDTIVQTSVLEDFIASIGYEPVKVDYEGHNPMKHKNKEILNHLQHNDSLNNLVMIEEMI